MQLTHSKHEPKKRPNYVRSTESFRLRSDGTVVGWGGNGGGIALGYETPDPGRTNGVVRINGQVLSNVVSIVAGRNFSLALKKDGTLVEWGQQKSIGTAPKLPDDNAVNQSIRIDSATGLPMQNKDDPMKKSVSVGIMNDGTVATRIGNQEPTPLTNITAIAVEWGHSWALKGDGTIVGWASLPENHDYGQLLPVENLSNVVSIAVGPGGYNTRGVALKSDGTVGVFGGASPSPPVGLSNVVAIAAGDSQSLALKSDGTVTEWRFNDFGQVTGASTTNAPNILSNLLAINGHVLSNVTAIAANQGCSLALRKDGELVAWSHVGIDNPANVPAGLSNVVAIAAGQAFCLAITTNKAVADKFRRQ